MELKPEVYKEYNLHQPKAISFTKKIIYKFFAASFWVWCIDNFNWLKILPKQARYKLYDIITTAHMRQK
jgi:hypothetical protein